MFDIKVTRRNFVLGSLVAGSLPLGSWAAAKGQAQPGSRRPPARLHKLLVDRNIPESVRLGAYSSAVADEVFVFDGDLTQLWNDELRSQWKTGPRPIAGLTAPSVRLVLEQLGRDHDARVVFSAEHRKVADGTRHSLAGSDSLLTSPEFRGSADWVADMAKYVQACPHEPPSRKTMLEYETGERPGEPGNQQRLVTWVLAPIFRLDGPLNTKTMI